MQLTDRLLGTPTQGYTCGIKSNRRCWLRRFYPAVVCETMSQSRPCSQIQPTTNIYIYTSLAWRGNMAMRCCDRRRAAMWAVGEGDMGMLANTTTKVMNPFQHRLARKMQCNCLALSARSRRQLQPPAECTHRPLVQSQPMRVSTPMHLLVLVYPRCFLSICFRGRAWDGPNGAHLAVT